MHRVALLVGLLLVPSCGPTRRPPELGQAERLASHGKIVEARKLLKVFDFSVATGLNRMLLDTNKRIDSWQKTFRVVDGELRAKLQRKTRYQVLAWARDQQRTADAAGNYYRAQAFLARMSQIEGFSKGIERIEDDPGGEPEPETRVVVEDDNESDLLGGALDNFLEDCTKLAAQGQYREAAKRLRNMMPLAGLGADRVRKALWAIEEKGEAEIEDLLAATKKLEQEGSGRKAYRRLVRVAKRFPDAGNLGRLRVEMEALDRRLQPKRLAKHDKLQKRLERATEVEKAGGANDSGSAMGLARRERRELAKRAKQSFEQRDYANAGVAYRRAAELSKGLHFEHRYNALAAEAELLVIARDGLKRALSRDPSAFKGIELGYGELATVLSANEEGVRCLIGKEAEVVPWHGIPDGAFAPLLARAAVTGEELLGAAVMTFHALDENGAVDLLKRAFAVDPKLKPSVDRVVARIKGESPGDGGYLLIDGQFVSARVKERSELRRRLSKVFNKLWAAGSDESRDKVYATVLAERARALDVAIDELTSRKEKLFRELMASPVSKALAKLLAQRQELDKRRDHAKTLIFDTVKYFYPYRPPAVSGAKAAEYAIVQREVDVRVEAVRDMWKATKGKVSLSRGVARKVKLYRWITGKLNELGVHTRDLDKELAVLVVKDSASIRTMALDGADRAFLDRGDAVDADNEVAFAELLADKKATRTEVKLIRITNAYRRMMGHHPLRCDARLIRAAHGHCEEMDRLGYFSHTSPTRGRKTPSDRTRLEGYPRGGSENLAINSGPGGAFYAWLHSSGHHRNLLSPAHKDMGTGNVGGQWAQVFGAGP
ncbi:MAG: hypothetical protein CMJ85_09305 [Planctomycetes bacterium]|nr:hypothetical protein [Planctomycetota bacterium]MDP6423744.1 CAP domain-containing protein [Planctomycetota bacterium]